MLFFPHRLQLVTLRKVCSRHRDTTCGRKYSSCCAFNHPTGPCGTVRPTWDNSTTLFRYTLAKATQARVTDYFPAMKPTARANPGAATKPWADSESGSSHRTTPLEGHGGGSSSAVSASGTGSKPVRGTKAHVAVAGKKAEKEPGEPAVDSGIATTSRRTSDGSGSSGNGLSVTGTGTESGSAGATGSTRAGAGAGASDAAVSPTKVSSKNLKALAARSETEVGSPLTARVTALNAGIAVQHRRKEKVGTTSRRNLKVKLENAA